MSEIRRGHIYPDMFVTHYTLDEANRYRGQPGQFTVLELRDNQCKTIAMELRYHDGITCGGIFYVPFARRGTAAAVSVVERTIELPANAPVVINHTLGRRPNVRVINKATGVVVTDVTVTHNSTSQLTVSTPTAITEAYVILE